MAFLIARCRAALLALALLAAGCAERGAESDTERAPASRPERIVAVAPSLVEVVFGLGAGDRVVGVGDYAKWPPEVFSRPRIGGLFDVRLEQIVELEPDLAVLLPGEEKLAAQMRELGVEVLTVRHESLDDVETSMRAIAGRLDIEAAGDEMAAAFRAALEPQPLAGSGRVLLAITREAGNLGEVLVAGPGTFYDELLGLLGAVNAFGNAALSYPQVSAEGVVRAGPDAIVELQPERLSRYAHERLLDDWRRLPGLTAVDGCCLQVISGDYVLLPGPRVTQLYRDLREALSACPAFGG